MADDEDVFGADFGIDSSDEEKTLREEERGKRTFQSEEDFLQQKESWTPKVETREELLQAVIRLHPPKTKFDVLTLKSAAELLYYSRDYTGALEVGLRVLEVATNEDTYVGSSERNEVKSLVEKCRRQLDTPGT